MTIEDLIPEDSTDDDDGITYVPFDQREPSPDIIDSITSKASLWPSTTEGMETMDWVYFLIGLTIGFSLTLVSSSLSGFFDPCLVQWAYITSSMFYFYLAMSIYMEKNYDDTQVMLLMILYFTEFGTAINLGQCSGDNKGFSNLRTDVMHIQVDDQDIPFPANQFLVWLFDIDPIQNLQSSNADLTAILAIVGVQGALLAY